MNILSLPYYIFVVITALIYYLLPKKNRWYVLLAGNIVFYLCFGLLSTVVLVAMILVSYFGARVIQKHHNENTSKQKRILFFYLALTVMPLLCLKYGGYALQRLHLSGGMFIIVPIGISFFTLQMIAYQVDVYRGKITAQNNILKYALFSSFFPQILQGPIPRYEQLSAQLIEGHDFEEKNVIKGMQRILWGFFLKLMIADKAAIVVNTVFGQWQDYPGAYILVAVILYAIQLYADFLACTVIAQGVAELFGVEIADNFNHPFAATSIKEFWGRWHMSLSSFLKDYIYVPLGGNRKGVFRKYVNLVITFVVSGFWHGAGIKYILWGFMQAFYQIGGDLTFPIREKIYGALGLGTESKLKQRIKQAGTFVLFCYSLIIFRADSARQGVHMMINMIIKQEYHLTKLPGDGFMATGLPWQELIVLAIAILLFFCVEIIQQKMRIRDVILSKNVFFRFALYIVAVVVIFVFGTYGFGFNAQDFIYGGF